MASLCPECGEELAHAVNNGVDHWGCYQCGFHKLSTLRSDCCDATYSAVGTVTMYYACDACGGACDPKVIEAYPAPETTNSAGKRT